MSDVALRVEGLGKRYRIGARAAAAAGRWDAARRLAAAPFAHLARMSRPPTEAETLWALRDVSFEVGHGEVVGLIGRNGAGKSTLLKILSRITEPTTGRAELHGRVGSLLEVGTGFHPELTGRENIYLNGAILGMRRAEIDRQFDQIVDFSGVEGFLDTPVKRYSSGMYVRLAFAVAAHLETEILLVDEVLAVGDAEFQRRCIGRMGEVAREGRTVVMVSHNMGSVVQLCRRAIALSEGRLVDEGPAEDVVAAYTRRQATRAAVVQLATARPPASPVVITRCWLENARGESTGVFGSTEAFHVAFDVKAACEVTDLEVSVRVHAANGSPLFTTDLSDGSTFDGTIPEGSHRLRVAVPSEFLAPDAYTVTIGIHRPNVLWLDLHEHVLAFTVVDTGAVMWKYPGAVRALGNILVRFPWTFQPGHEAAQPGAAEGVEAKAG